MQKKTEDFFKTLKYPDFLPMKLLSNVFERMNSSFDQTSKKIYDNIDALNNFNISLNELPNTDNYVWTADDLSESRMMISCKASDDLVCHEFAHLLLDLFANSEIPEEFEKVNEICVARLNSKQAEVRQLLSKYCDEIYGMIQAEKGDFLEFLDRHPEIEEEYLEKNPYDTKEDCANHVLCAFVALATNFNTNAVGYNKISNIIDAMYAGRNPFSYEYGVDELYPLLAMHESEYFLEDEHSPQRASFEEQFADYLVMRLFTRELGKEIGTLHSLIGDEWFQMMDKHYAMVGDRICEQGKTMVKKKEAE